MKYIYLNRSNLFFILRFIFLFLALYYFNLFYLGITDPKNFYSPFLDGYLNYISWISSSILNTANLIDHMFGLNSYVHENIIEVNAGASVILSYDCLGLGVISFWIAYVIADTISLQNKIFWSISGALLIWVINCWRIGILLLALEKNWNASENIDHHQVFNYLSYIIIIILIIYYNWRKVKLVSNDAVSSLA